MILKNSNQYKGSLFKSSKPRIADKRARLIDKQRFIDRRIRPLMAVILWMLGIFIMSAQTGDQSGGLSLGIVEAVLKWIGQWVHLSEDSALNTEMLHVLLRKSAHFMAYLILAILVRRLLAVDRFGLYKRQTFGMAVMTLLICVLYAISDEWHQSFVPGRGPGAMDVLIDGGGALLGIGIFKGAILLRPSVLPSRRLYV